MKNWPWFLLSLFVVAIDQISKDWAMSVLQPYESNPLLPILNMTLAFNTGAAFSFLSGTGGWHTWFFSGFSILVSVILAVWIVRMPTMARIQLLALSLILGGALGNLVDRVTFGYVIDFIDVHYKSYHWPIFNLADSAICVGALLLLVDMWFKHNR